MHRAILILTLLLLVSAVFAQYDERQILMQQANQHLVRREYLQAENIFLQILEKNPTDLNAIMQLMQIYLNLSAADKAETLLRDYQRFMPEAVYTEQRIQLLIMQGQIDQALVESEAYLARNPELQGKYKLLASYFERRGHFDCSIRLYKKAREAISEDLFALELGNAYMRTSQYSEALTEYLAYLSRISNLNLFVKNQIAVILEHDESLIRVIREASEKSDKTSLKELYAASLISLGQDEEALQVYKQLPINLLRDFAREQVKRGKYDLARAALRYLAANAPQEMQRLNYGLELASIYFQEAMYDSTAVEIEKLLEDPFWEKSVVNRRNQLYVNIRKLKAENDLARGIDIAQIRENLRETKQFSTIASEKQALDLDLARLAILSGDFAEASAALGRVRIPDLGERRDYLYFLSAFIQIQSAYADSLMNEFIIRYPGSDKANDMIYMNMLSLNLNEPQKATFAHSVQQLQLYQTSGIDSLTYLYEVSGDEEFLILAIEWSIGLGKLEKAMALLEHPFEDELASEYAYYLKLALLADDKDRLGLARDFLKTRPNSIFSPRFRQIISQRAASQISI
nr:hypothetical protein [Candidatus Cloacimonadota bacterium]